MDKRINFVSNKTKVTVGENELNKEKSAFPLRLSTVAEANTLHTIKHRQTFFRGDMHS